VLVTLAAASAWPVLHGVLKAEDSEGKQNSLWEMVTKSKGGRARLKK